jgi:hypothetical protein
MGEDLRWHPPELRAVGPHAFAHRPLELRVRISGQRPGQVRAERDRIIGLFVPGLAAQIGPVTAGAAEHMRHTIAMLNLGLSLRLLEPNRLRLLRPVRRAATRKQESHQRQQRGPHATAGLRIGCRFT